MHTKDRVKNEGLSTAYMPKHSYSKKKARNYKLIEDTAEYWYGYFTKDTEEIEEYLAKLDMNADLMNGRLDRKYRLNDDVDMDIDIGGDSLSIGAQSAEIPHHNIISPIARALSGEQQKRPFKPLVVDRSLYEYNSRKKETINQVQQVLDQRHLEPLRQNIMMQYMQEHGIEDFFQLDPEEQDQANQEIAQNFEQVAAEELGHIMKYMRKGYKGPLSKLGEEVLKIVTDEHKVKFFTDEGMKTSLWSGQEVYYVNSIDGRTVFELVNPRGFRNFNKKTSFFVEESEACVYERELLFSELFTKYGHEISARKFEEKLKKIVGSQRTRLHERDGTTNSRLVAEISANKDKYNLSKIDIRTRQGQAEMAKVYARAGNAVRGLQDYTVPCSHICFRMLRKFKRVLRVMPDGQVKRYWMDEHYQLNPNKGDIEYQTYWLPEIWETDRIGQSSEGIYVNKRRVPWQYKAHDDPYNTLMPYIGSNYSTMLGNSKNIAPIDLAKPWQDKFDIQMAKIDELDQNNWGNIFLMGKKHKPKEMGWSDWLKLLKYGKIGILDDISAHEAQMIKNINMTTLNEISAKVQYLDYLYNMAARAMSYNMSRLGEVSPYMTVTNNQQNIIQSSHQTENIFNLHASVVERVLEALVRAKLHALRENPIDQTYLLSDMSVGLLEVKPFLLDLAKFQVKLSMDPDEYEKLLELKRAVPQMMGSGMVEFDEYVKSVLADNVTDMVNLADEIKERRDQRIAQEQEARQQELAMQEEARQKMFEMEAQLKLLLQEREAKVKMYQAEMDSQKFAAQYDINNNNINDTFEREIEKIKADLKKFREEMALEKAKFEQEKKEHRDKVNLEKEKLRIEKMKARNTNRST